MGLESFGPKASWQDLQRFFPSSDPQSLVQRFRCCRRCRGQGRIPAIANMHNYANLKYYRNISQFVPVLQTQKRYLMDGGVTEKNITVIPHFSMIPVAEKETAVNGDESPVLVSFGRFVHKKGFHILIDAIEILADSGLNIKLVLGGEGPEREKLRNQVETLNLQNQISFPGWVENVSFFLTQGSYFVLPSLNEPFGIVILEAMASGKVILASRSEGPNEILDSSTAWMFELNDPVEPCRSCTASHR